VFLSEEQVPHSCAEAQVVLCAMIDEQVVAPSMQTESAVFVCAGLALDYGSLGRAPLPQLLSSFVSGGVQLADIPRPVWRLIESVIVPYVIDGALGTRAFPPEYQTEQSVA
jgi:hypothetical protein